MLTLRTQISVALIVALASTAALAQRGGGFIQSNDPRVQNRIYHYLMGHSMGGAGTFEAAMPDIFAFFQAHKK